MQSQFQHFANLEQLGKRKVEKVGKSGTGVSGQKKVCNKIYKKETDSKLKLCDEESTGNENGSRMAAAAEQPHRPQ